MFAFFTLNLRRNGGTYRAKELDTLLVQLRSTIMLLEVDIFPFSHIQPVQRISECVYH